MQVIKDFADLPAILPSTPTKSTKKEKKPKIQVEPVYVSRLRDAGMKLTQIAKLIDVSDGYLSTSLTTGSIRQTVELAAQAIYQKEYEPARALEKNGQVFVSLLISKEALARLEPWFKASNVDYNIFSNK